MVACDIIPALGNQDLLILCRSTTPEHRQMCCQHEVCASEYDAQEARREHWIPGAGVRGFGELSNAGAGNWPWALWKSKQYVLLTTKPPLQAGMKIFQRDTVPFPLVMILLKQWTPGIRISKESHSGRSKRLNPGASKRFHIVLRVHQTTLQERLSDLNQWWAGHALARTA